MSETGLSLLTVIQGKRDELKDEPYPRREPGHLRHEFGDEINRVFPGFDHASVLSRAFRITLDRAGAEDVVQSLIFNLLRLSEGQRAGIRSLDLYIAVSIRNLAIRWCQMHRPGHHESLSVDFDERVTEDCADRVADEDEINFMLAQLPASCRETFVYFFAEDYTAQEVAARLGISVEAVKKRLQRGLLKLLKARAAYRSRQR